jgi:hypothetical protein
LGRKAAYLGNGKEETFEFVHMHFKYRFEIVRMSRLYFCRNVYSAREIVKGNLGSNKKWIFKF